MSNETEIDIRFYQRRWLARLFGQEPFRFEIDLPSGMMAAADAKTVQGAWNGALLSAKWFTGTEIISPCPYDDKGRRIPAEASPPADAAHMGSSDPL